MGENDDFGGDIDEEVEILNKHVIKTFETKGAKIDCFDINKQPSLDHSSLRHHIVQLRPTSRPKDLRSKSLSLESASRLSWGDVGLGYTCPKGTVPIRRTTKSDRIRAKALLKSFQSGTDINYPNEYSYPPPGQHVAIQHSYVAPPNPPFVFFGIQGEIIVNNPAVDKDQISSSVLWVDGGSGDTFSTIQSGWTVAPTLFGDNKTHFSIYWRTGRDKGDCFNMYCNGFVQASDQVPIGDVLPSISEYGGKQYGFTGLLFQDRTTRNWWFSITANNVTYDIGYLPRELVPYLDPADYLAWGGIVKSPPNTPSPPMGNGHFPDGDVEKTAAIFDHMYVDQTNALVTPQDRDFENDYDSPDCYKTQDDDNPRDGYSIFFGGPGGMNC